jgi:hypothetical protein
VRPEVVVRAPGPVGLVVIVVTSAPIALARRGSQRLPGSHVRVAPLRAVRREQAADQRNRFTFRPSAARASLAGGPFPRWAFDPAQTEPIDIFDATGRQPVPADPVRHRLNQTFLRQPGPAKPVNPRWVSARPDPSRLRRRVRLVGCPVRMSTQIGPTALI